jgi:hypothetical protein
VINDTAQTLKVGAVLGKVTATGKYKLALSAAVDGSQTPVAVLIADGMGLLAISCWRTPPTRRPGARAWPVHRERPRNLQLGTGITAAAAKSALAAVGITR